MGRVSIILRRPPYGTVDASEAIRHALGGATEDVSVNLILVDSGINSAKKGQELSSTEYLSIESGIRDCIDMGVNVYVDKASLKKERLEIDEIIEGVIVLTNPKIAGLIEESDTTMIF